MQGTNRIGSMELAVVHARTNGHCLSSFEQCVDTLRACCIDCGAEVVLVLDKHLNNVADTRHMGTQFQCQSLAAFGD